MGLMLSPGIFLGFTGEALGIFGGLYAPIRSFSSVKIRISPPPPPWKTSQVNKHNIVYLSLGLM